jgi:hypothetical protein
MHTQANDDYVPFGDEWRREMMRWRKAVLACALALAGACFAQLLWLCAKGCARERAPQNRALAENIRRGVYPAGDWDKEETWR